jgi:hypothetical protein
VDAAFISELQSVEETWLWRRVGVSDWACNECSSCNARLDFGGSSETHVSLHVMPRRSS